MTGRSLLLKALRCEEGERVPWVPFVGVHGGQLVGVDAETYLKSADHIVNAQLMAAERYLADGLPVIFDLQVEAEILGCDLQWAKDSPPSVCSHPLGDDDEIEMGKLPVFDVSSGRFPLGLEATRRLREALADTVALYGLITGPLTLAMHLRGDDLFTDIFDDEEAVKQLLAYCADVGATSAKAYLEAGADVVAVVDPMTSQISAAHFNEFVASPLNVIFDAIGEAGGISSLFVCGNATRNLEVMAQTRCHNMSVDENVDLAKLKTVCQAAGKSYGGNLKLTTALLLGDENDVKRDAVACYDIGEGKGFVLAPGCDLPYAVPPANLMAVAEIVRDPYQRDVARQLPPSTAQDSFEDIEIPDYAASQKVIVDVVTLDSAGCAPCAYMLSAAQEAARASAVPVLVEEHKITTRDGLGYMTKLGVSAIPSICIQGKPAYASIIPERKELVQAITSASQHLAN